MRRLICVVRGHGSVHVPTLQYRPHTRWCRRHLSPPTLTAAIALTLAAVSLLLAGVR